MNLRADILSRRVLGGCLKFLFELGVLSWIKFEEETPGIFQRNLVRNRQRIVLPAKRMHRAHQIKLGLCVRYTPDATLRQRSHSADRYRDYYRKTEKNARNPTPGISSKRQKHFRSLARKLSKSINSTSPFSRPRADRSDLRSARFSIVLRRHGPPRETLVRCRVAHDCHRSGTNSGICRG